MRLCTNQIGETMKVYDTRFLPVLLIVVLSILHSSCTYIGLGIGVIVDLSRPNSETIQIEDLFKLKKNDRILIHLINDSTISGGFYELLSFTVESVDSNNYSTVTLINSSNNEKDSISIANIVAIEKKNPNNSWKKWGLTGLALDLFFWVVIVGDDEFTLGGAD